MASFVLLSVLLVLAVLAVVLVPILRGQSPDSKPDPRAPVIAAFRQQRREIEEEFARGNTSEQERSHALSELVERAGEELPNEMLTVSARHARPWMVAAIFAVLVPALAVPLYLALGAREAINSAGQPSGAPTMSPHEIDAALAALAKKLEEQPDDINGWILLGRSHYSLGHYDQAVAAFEKANALFPHNADVLANEADSVAMAQGQSLAGRPRSLIQEALAADPNNKKALALAAAAELNDGNREASIAYWRRLLAELPAGSDDAKEVAGAIDEIQAKGGVAVDQAAAQTTDAAASDKSISGTVSLAPELATKVGPTDTVFIFARAVAGPRMPLAVLRIAATELPKTFTLDDSLSMAGMKLSSARDVKVEARVSKSGNAGGQPGDLAGDSMPVHPGVHNINLVIDRVLQ